MSEPEAILDVGRSGSIRLPAWLLSFTLHLILMVGSVWIVQATPRGIPAEPEREAGIVLVNSAASAPNYFTEEQVTGGRSPSPAPSQPQPVAMSTGALPTATELPVDLTGALPSPDEVGAAGFGGDLAAALPGAAAMTTGPGPTKNFGDATKTYVFGIEAQGGTFVYVFDRSGSMEGFQGRPLAAAKSELLASLKSLRSTDQFQIVFYNNQLSVFNPLEPQPARLMFGDDRTKQLAEQYVRAIVGLGGTRHMEPLSLAVRMAPDAIFFLTDAAEPELTPGQLQQLRRANKGTVIHAIEFGPGSFPGGDNFLMRLARQNGGRYVYVDVSKLPGPAQR